MKKFSVQRLGLLAVLALFCCAALPAQEQRKITVIKKGAPDDVSLIAHEGRPILGIYPDEGAEGQGIKISSIIEGKGAQAAGLKDGDVIVIVDGQAVDQTHELHSALAGHKPGDEVNVQYLRDGNNATAIVRLSASDDHKAFSLERDPCKVFIGVGTSSVSGGLEVDYTVDNTPATESGVKAGDIILALDGVAVSTQSELVYERDKHQPGEAFTLSILRDGRQLEINARFKECSEEELARYQEQKEAHQMELAGLEERMKAMQARIDEMFTHNEAFKELANLEKMERPILGVYEDEGQNKQGFLISSVIEGKGADAAGLKAGDLVTVVDGKAVTGTVTLRHALSGHQPGDRVPVVYQRDGQTLQTEVVLSAGHSFLTHRVERDPCKVFIGVYTSDMGAGEPGVRVSGVIDDTPAKVSGVQPGDIILALDGQPINTHMELRRERDKHQPGEAFRLTVLRDGASVDIDAAFKTCQEPTPGDAPVQEVVEVLTEDVPAGQRTDPGASLQVHLNAFPNPTVGVLNIRFEAEAVPTTVSILDVSGKAVYTTTLNQFSGSFNEQVNLYGNKPGTYVLSVRQGDKVYTRPVVLMPRA